jgi:hypothetical protein
LDGVAGGESEESEDEKVDEEEDEEDDEPDIKTSDFEKLEHHPDFTIIGHMNELTEGIKMVSKSGKIHDLKAQGWTAF